MHQHDHHSTAAKHSDHAAFWEEHYGTSDRVWSGKVNQTLAQTLSQLTAGKSLDFGCGEGADVLWLAAQGWQATGVDISATAIQRARTEAELHGFNKTQADFIAADLNTWVAEERFDLVTLSFFQAPFEFPRSSIFAKAMSLVAPGGHLVALSHAARPSWAPESDGMHLTFPSPESEVAELNNGTGTWKVLQAEIVQRDLIAPNGEPATLEDTIVLAQRIA